MNFPKRYAYNGVCSLQSNVEGAGCWSDRAVAGTRATTSCCEVGYPEAEPKGDANDWLAIDTYENNGNT